MPSQQGVVLGLPSEASRNLFSGLSRDLDPNRLDPIPDLHLDHLGR